MQFTATIFFGVRETNKITSSYTCRVKDTHIHTNTQTRSSKNGLLRGQKKQEVHIDTCLRVFFGQCVPMALQWVWVAFLEETGYKKPLVSIPFDLPAFVKKKLNHIGRETSPIPTDRVPLKGTLPLHGLARVKVGGTDEDKVTTGWSDEAFFPGNCCARSSGCLSAACGKMLCF